MGAIDQTLGLLFIALVITSGVMSPDVFYYRRHWKRDGITLKSLVALIMIFDICQQAFVATALYDYCVTNHGNDAIIATVPHSLIIQAIFGGFVAIMVQMFNIYRIWKLSRGKWYCIPVTGSTVALSVATLIVLMVYCGKAVVMQDVSQLPTLDPFTTSANVGAAATDVTISVVIIWLLRGSKHRTTFKTTNDMISRLINFTLNTGSLTSINALFAVITLKVWPETHLYMFFYLMLGRIYTNSLLATLNARDYIRSTGHSEGDSWSNPAVIQNMPMGTRGTSTRNNNIAIRIDTVATHDGGSDKDYLDNQQKVGTLGTSVEEGSSA